MKVIKHGELYKEEKFTCRYCKCEYIARVKECEYITFRNRHGQLMHEISCDCPECHKRNSKYKTGGTESDRTV